MCIGPELITEAEYLAVIKLNTTLTAFCLILDGEKNKKKKERNKTTVLEALWLDAVSVDPFPQPLSLSKIESSSNNSSGIYTHRYNFVCFKDWGAFVN